jgi:integrase
MKQNTNDILLVDVLQKYLKQRRNRPLSNWHIVETTKVFNRFCSIIRKQYLSEITFQDFQDYNETIYKLSEDKGRADLYILKNFNDMRTIFRGIIKKEEHKEDLARIISYFEVLDFPSKQKTEPVCISKEQFKKLYEQTSGLTRLMFLLGINCGYTKIDIVSLKKSMIDLDNRTIKRERHKTTIKQVSYLWDETVEEIKKYMTEHPNNSEYLLLSKFGLPFSELTLRDYWCNKIEGVNHKWLRSSVRTVATLQNNNDNLIRILMGHTALGITDSYLAKRPEYTKPVVESVHRYYFGDCQQQTNQSL